MSDQYPMVEHEIVTRGAPSLPWKRAGMHKFGRPPIGGDFVDLAGDGSWYRVALIQHAHSLGSPVVGVYLDRSDVPEVLRARPVEAAAVPEKAAADTPA